MAGGSGTRFWPRSRQKNPKQVLNLFGEHSLIQDTVLRLDGLVPTENILIVTNAEQKELIAPQLPDFTDANYVIEPAPLNTAPCIGLAAIHIKKKNPKAVMMVLPSDHRISNLDLFHKRVLLGIELARKHDSLVTMGIPPTRPETGYGYIQFSGENEGLPDGVSRVITFAEKPNLSTAQRFVNSGDFYWNSGMFIWSVKRILTEMEEHLPEQFFQLSQIAKSIRKANYSSTLENHYNRIRPISIDYGVMEVSKTAIMMITGDFGWSDVGSWDEMYRIALSEIGDGDGNVLIGEAISHDTKNCYVNSPDKMTAILGLEDVLVINTPTATLICSREKAQDVKAIVDKLRKAGKLELL